MKKRKNIIVIGLGIAALTGTYTSKSAQVSIPNIVRSTEKKSQDKQYDTIQGELIDDYIEKTVQGEYYRIIIKTKEGQVTYPVVGTKDELRNLEKRLISRNDLSIRHGDEIAILVTNKPYPGIELLATTQVSLIKSFAQEPATSSPIEYILSNNMRIPGSRIWSIENSDKGKIIVVNQEHTTRKLCIYDEGDGKPYHIVETGWQHWENGKLVEDQTKKEKRFNLTYKFCDIHDPYPIWDKTAYKRDKCYKESPRLQQREKP